MNDAINSITKQENQIKQCNNTNNPNNPNSELTPELLKRNEKRNTIINSAATETSFEKLRFTSEAKKRNTINFSTSSSESIKSILDPSSEEKHKQNAASIVRSKLFTVIDDFLYGLGDSLQIFNIFGIIKSSERMMLNLRNCILLNGLILLSSNVFYSYFLDPWLNYYVNSVSNFYFFSIGKYFYFTFWLIPIFLACNITTAFWIDEVYYDSLEKVENTKLINIEGTSAMTAIANQIQRQLIVISFIFVINFLNIFFNFFSYFSPLLANFFFAIKFFAMSILNSLYVFEYILMQKYLKSFKSILYFIENKIFYFFGYGILMTLLVNFIDSVAISSALFLILFPFFLVASVKVNNKRFAHQKEIKIGKLKFFYLIDLIYDNLLRIIFKIFRLRN